MLCLGVKDAFGESHVSAADVRELIDERLPADFREPIHPTCAKKLIEGAISYAQALGFAPHRDFRKARKVLSSLDASHCPTEFTFGQDGRPCYVRGQDDDDARVSRVLNVLESRLGSDGFSFVDPVEELDQTTDDVRDALLVWLEDEAPAVPRFFEVSGLVTGLQLCPQPISPLKLFDVLWGAEGRDWGNQQELETFTGVLMAYWNHVAGLIENCLDPDADPEVGPIDIRPEEYPLDDGMEFAASMVCWAVGFKRATAVQPEAWAGALARVDLVPYWEVVNWWVTFEREESRDAIVAAAEKQPSRTLGAAVAALARALRHGA